MAEPCAAAFKLSSGCATLINKLGNEHKEALLPSIASGELTAVLAADESGHYNLDYLHSQSGNGGFVISGVSVVALMTSRRCLARCL